MEEEGFVNYSALLHCAVYMLVRRKVVVYVGKSKSLSRRLHEHCVRRGKAPAKKSYYGTSEYNGVMFDQIFVRPCMMAELDTIEVVMIKKYQPKYNVVHKDKPKPEISLEELLKNMPLQAYPMLPPAPATRASANWRRL